MEYSEFSGSHPSTLVRTGWDSGLCNNETVLVIDTSANTVVATIPVRQQPDAVGWSQRQSTSTMDQARLLRARITPSVSIGRGNQATCTITLTTFPLENGNPFDDVGTVVGTFTFVCELVKPSCSERRT
jgi:YVTN family beta-propeller protein